MKSTTAILLGVFGALFLGCDGETASSDESAGANDYSLIDELNRGEDVSQAESYEADQDVSVGEVEIVGTEEEDEFAVSVTDMYVPCSSGEADSTFSGTGDFYNACEECMCTLCSATMAACAKSPGCITMTMCMAHTGCVGPACLEQCNDDLAPWGGIAGKAADLTMRQNACLLEYCFDECAVEGGIKDGPEAY